MGTKSGMAGFTVKPIQLEIFEPGQLCQTCIFHAPSVLKVTKPDVIFTGVIPSASVPEIV